MKHLRKIFIATLFSSSLFSYSQVGINTTSPKATLDVVATLDKATVPPGIIAPRLTRSQLINISTNYGQDQIGSIIFITDLSGTNNTATQNIVSEGYYYFDGNKWIAIGGNTSDNPWFKVGTTTPSTSNTDNSFLTAQVVIGGNAIGSVNGGTNNAQLTVTGNDALINEITVGKGAGSVVTNTAIGYKALSTNTSGSNNTVIGSNAGTKITTGNNNVIIGSNTDVLDATSSNQINIGNTLFGVTGNSSTDVGRISIGKTKPDNNVTLDINGTTQITGTKSLRYMDGKQADNKVLVSDSEGYASWEKLNVLNAPMFPAASSGNGYTGDLVKGINSGISITLPPYSVWVVELGQIIRFQDI